MQVVTQSYLQREKVYSRPSKGDLVCKPITPSKLTVLQPGLSFKDRTNFTMSSTNPLNPTISSSVKYDPLLHAMIFTFSNRPSITIDLPSGHVVNDMDCSPTSYRIRKNSYYSDTWFLDVVVSTSYQGKRFVLFVDSSRGDSGKLVTIESPVSIVRIIPLIRTDLLFSQIGNPPVILGMNPDTRELAMIYFWESINTGFFVPSNKTFKEVWYDEFDRIVPIVDDVKTVTREFKQLLRSNGKPLLTTMGVPMWYSRIKQ